MKESKKIERPISPHVGIYKPQLTSVLSILHRITGIVLSVGLVVFSLFLIATAYAPDMREMFIMASQNPLGQLAIWGSVFCLYFHLCTGIRHLFWDAGIGYEIKTVYKTGRFAVGAAIVLTAITWKMGAGL